MSKTLVAHNVGYDAQGNSVVAINADLFSLLFNCHPCNVTRSGSLPIPGYIVNARESYPAWDALSKIAQAQQTQKAA